jgi:tight adherence protein B
MMLATAAAVLAVLLWFPPLGLTHVVGRAVPGLGRWRWPHPARAAERRAAELEWVDALAAELRAGRDPVSAVRAAGATVALEVCPRARAAALGGGDVARALRADGAASELLRSVAACWEVAHGSGAGLSASLHALSDSARDAARIRNDLRVGMAEPRATAVVLACLPVVGLALGVALGADPLSWLLGSGPGLLLLAVAVALELAGAWWSWRIAVRLEADL